MNKGVLYAAASYAIWGFFPLYFHAINAAPPLQIVAHRVFWSFLCVGAAILLRKEFSSLRKVLTWRVVLIYLTASILLAANWLIYVWAVNSGFVLQASLGYYINPLVSVICGVALLRERLRPLQWLPIALAASGVLYLDSLNLRYPALEMDLTHFWTRSTRAAHLLQLAPDSTPRTTLHHLHVPTQTNSYDCGFFVLAYLRATQTWLRTHLLTPRSPPDHTPSHPPESHPNGGHRTQATASTDPTSALHNPHPCASPIPMPYHQGRLRLPMDSPAPTTPHQSQPSTAQPHHSTAHPTVPQRRRGDNPNPTATGNDQDGSLRENRFWLSASLPL